MARAKGWLHCIPLSLSLFLQDSFLIFLYTVNQGVYGIYGKKELGNGEEEEVKETKKEKKMQKEKEDAKTYERMIGDAKNKTDRVEDVGLSRAV